jgi:hypothetical protein
MQGFHYGQLTVYNGRGSLLDVLYQFYIKEHLINLMYRQILVF